MKSGDLTLTIESKITDLGELYSKLEEYGSFYNHLERTLFQKLAESPIVDSLLRKNLKAEFMADFKIQGRIFNALWVQVKAKLDSFGSIKRREEDKIKSKIKILKAKIKKLEKEIKDRKRKHGLGFVWLKHHEAQKRKQTLSWLKIKLDKLENFKISENFTFGSHSFFLKQYTDPKYINDHNLWKKEWKRRRNNHFYFLGSHDEPNQNQHCQYRCNERLETLKLTLPYCFESKIGRYLEVPVKFSSESTEKNQRYYNYFKEAVKLGVALSYEFLQRENGFWYVFVTFALPKETHDFKTGYIGLDVNYNLIASADCDRSGNYTGFKNYRFDSESLDSNQSKDQLALIVKDLVTRAKASGKSIVIEDLDFTKLKLKPRNKKTNRKLNLIQYSTFRTLLKSRCLKNGVRLKIVNPAYSSIIGKNKYAKLLGVSTHTAAAFVLARRGSYKVKERLPNQMIGILHRGEAEKFERVFRYRHHWSHWAFLSKNLESCLKQVCKTCGDSIDTRGIYPKGIDMNYLKTRFNPEKKSFLLRYLENSAC